MSMQNMSSHQRDFVGEICFFLSLFWQIVQGIGGIAQRFQKRSNRGEILNGSLNFFNQKIIITLGESVLYKKHSHNTTLFATPFFMLVSERARLILNVTGFFHDILSFE